MENRVPDQGYYLSSSVVPNVYGWVEVNGEPLERKTPPETDYNTQVYVDGSKAGSNVWRRNSRKFSEAPGDEDRYHRITGRKTSKTTRQPFLFSKLKTTDSDELACTDEQVVKNLGTIQLRYQRVENIRPATGPRTFAAAEPKVIHEKAKKAQLSHQAAYGESVQIKETGRSTFDWIDEEASPLFQFEFRYRSRRSPTPSPEPELEQSQSPETPVASTSNINRSVSATQPSPAPQNEDAQERLARLEAQYESLRRQEEMARLQREIAALRGEVGASPSSSSARKIKAEPSEDQRELKRVKQENREASPSQSSGSGKGKGKERKTADVIVLSDSD